MRIQIDERLSLSRSNMSELNELNQMYEEVVDYFSFDPTHEIIAPFTCLSVGDLPSGGIKNNYEMLSIYDHSKLIGYMTLYKGYPTEDIVYLTFLYVSTKHRNKGYGEKIMDVITIHYKLANYKKMRLSVSLRNWGGIKFWYKQGFNQLTNVDLEGENIKHDYACIELEKIIK